jgi:hypothetical protein
MAPKRSAAGSSSKAQRAGAPAAHVGGNAAPQYLKATFSLTREQIERIRALALERAAGKVSATGTRGSAKPDSSALVREALEEWLAKQPSK